MVLSKCRPNDGPKQTKILVTNMPETVTAREIVGVYLRRWSIELLMKDLKGVVGLGQHQVTKHVDRVERSVAVAIMAYLLLLKLHAKHIPADRPWSAFTCNGPLPRRRSKGSVSVRHAKSLLSGFRWAKLRNDI